MNTVYLMNSHPDALERKLLGKLREILSDVSWPAEFLAAPTGDAPDQFDAMVKLRPGAAKAAVLFVECKRDVRPATFEPWARRLAALATKRRGTPVLGLPVVSARMADLCRGTGWSWFDLAGNCSIDVPGLLHVERTGNAPVRRSPRPGANLGTAAAARVLRVLASPGHAGRAWKHRDLQLLTSGHIHRDSPVSIGLVNKVVRHLLDQGFAEDAGDEGIRVRDVSGLLAAWRAAYRFDRHERRSYFTLLKGAALAKALCGVAPRTADATVYAALSAAERQAPHVRQQKTWVYVRPPYLDALVRRTEAKEVESGENLVVLVPEDAGVFLSFEADSSAREQTIGCTGCVQTYLDLFHCGGRGEEAAQALLEQRILPAWREIGVA